MPPPTLYAIAQHEGAHAALATHLACEVLKIDVAQRCTTICFRLAPAELSTQYARTPLVARSHVRDSLAILLAGSLAHHGALLGTADGDDLAAWRVAWDRLPARDGAWGVLRAQAEAQARRFLQAQWVQAPMARLVHALLHARVLTGARLAAFLEPFGVSEVPTPRRQAPLSMHQGHAPAPLPRLPPSRPTPAVVPTLKPKVYTVSTPAPSRPAWRPLSVHDQPSMPLSDWRLRQGGFPLRYGIGLLA